MEHDAAPKTVDEVREFWLFAGLIALALSLVTIAIAWMFYRPIVGIPLLIAAGALIVFLKQRGAARRDAAAIAQAQQGAAS